MRLHTSLALSALAAVLLFLPVLANAQSLLNTLGLANTFLNMAIGFFVTLAIIAFFYGLVKYLFTKGAEGSGEGLKIMFWGVIAIFVMVSVWGIIRLLQNTFGVISTDPIIPKGAPMIRPTSF